MPQEIRREEENHGLTDKRGEKDFTPRESTTLGFRGRRRHRKRTLMGRYLGGEKRGGAT